MYSLIILLIMWFAIVPFIIIKNKINNNYSSNLFFSCLYNFIVGFSIYPVTLFLTFLAFGLDEKYHFSRNINFNGNILFIIIGFLLFVLSIPINNFLKSKSNVKTKIYIIVSIIMMILGLLMLYLFENYILKWFIF